MQLHVYRNRTHSEVDAADFAVFKAESKYVIGLTANGDEYLLLPDRMSLKELLVSVQGLMRVSRSVLVARRSVELMTGTRDERCVHVAGQQYKLSRDEIPERFEEAAIENAELCAAKPWGPGRDLPERCAAKPWNRGRDQLNHDLKSGMFYVFRVEQKRVIAITACLEKWCLPANVRLSDLERTVPGLMRVNRSVLVARTKVERVSGGRDERCVRAFGMEYSLSREIDPTSFRMAASENSSNRSAKIRSQTTLPDHSSVPAFAQQMSSHTIGVLQRNQCVSRLTAIQA